MQINVNDLGGGVQGCCPGYYILHCEGPGVVGRLFHLVMGDWEGLILRQGVTSSIGPGCLCNVAQFCAKFVRNSYRIRTKKFTILDLCESCVNLCVKFGQLAPDLTERH